MAKFKNIALVFSGIIIGVAISFSTDIQAATSKLLGGTVAKTVVVKVDGSVIGEGGIINGTTYLPVRTLVNSIDGIEVGEVSTSEVNLVTDDSSGDVVTNIDLAEKAKQEQAAMDKQVQDINGVTKQIREVKNKIKHAQGNIDEANSDATKRIKDIISQYESNPIPERKTEIDSYKSVIEKINTDAEAAKKEIETLNQQLTDLESQLAELQK